MIAFSDLLAQANSVIFTTLGDPAAILTPANGGAQVAGAAIVRRPSEAEVFKGATIVKAKPEVHAPVSTFPEVRKGDVFTIEGRRWRLAEAPRRPGHGHIWVAEADDLGDA